MNLESLVNVLDAEGADLVIKYGSRTFQETVPSDVDLLVIGTDTSDRSNFQLGDFDVIRLSWAEFDGYRERLDPVYCTEPILEGTLIRGSPTDFSQLREMIAKRTPDRFVVQYNLQRAFKEYQRACRLPYAEAIEPLGYVASYWLVSRWYRSGNSPTPLRKIIQKTTQQKRLERVTGIAVSPSEGPSSQELTSDEAWEIIFDLILNSENYMQI